MHIIRRATAASVATTIAAGILTAGAADGALVVQQSLAGVKLGMTRAQVEAKLGEPSEVKRPTSEIFGRYTELRFGLTKVSIFDSAEGGVFAVTTTSKKQRTSRDVGVGTSEKVLRQRVKGVRCETFSGFRTCSVGRFEPGRTVTTFRIGRTSKRVASIQLGRVID